MVRSGAGNEIAGSEDNGFTQRRMDDLQRRNEELAAAVAARDAFLAIAAHELRNPMTPIMGQVQRLRRLVESRNCSLADVEANLRRIEWLVDLYVKRATTLLDVSRITSGKLRLEIDKVNISELVRNLAGAFEPAIQYARSSLRLEAGDNLVAETDRLALEQILDNLLLNAIKFGAGKPIAVTAAFEGNNLCIAVRDEGIGMSEKDQARIFEPFERALAYGAQAGFGIGLWVVRQLVDTLGGEIKVNSAIEKGTTFKVIVPRGMEAQR